MADARSPRPVQPSTVLARQEPALAKAGDAARRLRRCRRQGGGILDCRCARPSANRQIGTKGWSCPIEQRDANFDLIMSSAGPPPMTDLLNFAHTTIGGPSPE